MIRFALYLISILLVLSYCSISEASPVAQEFVNGYNRGQITNFAADCTDNRLPCDEVYREYLQRNAGVQIHLSHVYYSDRRVVADFDANGKTGTMTMWTDGDKITRIYHENEVYENTSDRHIADAGQAADGLSTAINLSTGDFSEANPFRPSSAVGNLAFSAGIIGIRHYVKENVGVGQCIQVSKALSAAGWAGAAGNLTQLAGATLGLAIPLAIIAGGIAYMQNYKGECVPYDHYLAEMV